MAEGTGLGNINTPIINMNDANVAHNPNDKASGEEYFDRRRRNQEEHQDPFANNFVDRTAQLRATLNSLASLNAVNVIQSKDKYKKKTITEEKEEEEKLEKEKNVSNPIKEVESQDKEEQNEEENNK